MRKASRQTFPVSPWVVQKRIRQRQLGYRMHQVKKLIIARMEETGMWPSLREICEETGIDGKGNASRIVNSLTDRGELPTRAA